MSIRRIITVFLCLTSFYGHAQFANFITREGSQLFDGSQPFRFVGLHAAELHRIEDDARGKCLADPRGWGQYFKWPSAEEQENWIQSLVKTGHTATRIYVLSVAHPTDNICAREVHINPPSVYQQMPQLNETAMRVYDRMIALADVHGLRLILPFIDHWQWWGGRAELAAFYGESEDALYDTSSKTYRAYQHIIQQVITRKNHYTGKYYYEEKAIMAWETGNELKFSTTDFVAKTAALIKALAPNQLVIDGNYLSILESSLNDDNVDIISNHFYTVNGNNNPATVINDLTTIDGRKAYFVGEYGLLPIEQMRDIMNTVVEHQVNGHQAVGALIWGMRGRRHNGGFYWHREGDSGYSSYHLPGFPEGSSNQEEQVVELIRQAQAKMRGLQTTPALAIPSAPTLRRIAQNRRIDFLGSDTATSYTIQRRQAGEPDWQVIADHVSDGIKEFNPRVDSLFIDREILPTGQTYEYRVLAKNGSGQSLPSNIQTVTIVEPDPSSFVSVNDGQFYRNGQPYYFVGANYWYGPLLGATEVGRARLIKELDLLNAHGINNLRVLVGAEGSIGNSVIKPALQPSQRQYDENLLIGLDVFLDELGKRDMQAVLYLNNNWIWSGGYSQYLQWNGYGKVPNPFEVEYDWSQYMKYAGQFYDCIACIDAYHDHIRFILNRTNSVNGIRYTDDSTIMSWQLANEPRIFFQSNVLSFRKWLHDSVELINSLAPSQLVSTGSEGAAGSLNNVELFAHMHQHDDIDYLTMHIWPKNWSWFDPEHPEQSLATSTQKAFEYMDEHIRIASAQDKPIVLSEFGFPRDAESLLPSASVSLRDSFYTSVLQRLIESKQDAGPYSGINFWAFGGYGRSNPENNGVWQQGDDYLGDPAQEPQGLNTVFSSDVSTLGLLKQVAEQLEPR